MPPLPRLPIVPGTVALLGLALVFVGSRWLHASCSQMRATVPMIILQERGPWRCVEVPGFLIYSRLSDAICQRFADELRQHNLQLAVLGSESASFQTLSNQIPVVLRVADRPFVNDQSPGTVEVYDDEVWLIYVVELPREIPADPAAQQQTVTPFPFPGMALSVPAGPPTPAEWLARDAFWRRYAYTRPAGPQWLRHGLERLMAETRITPTGLQLGRPTTRPAMPEAGVEELFNAPYSDEDPYRHEALARQAAMFLRWAMVIDPARRERLWSFAHDSAQRTAPVDEAMLLEAFDMTYGQIAVELTDPTLHRAQIAGSGNRSDLQLSAVRLAHEEEVDRLVRTINGINERATAHNATMAATN